MNETHQAVKPFSSRMSGCKQTSCARSCSSATKLCSERLFGVSTGRPCARRRAVELGRQSESHGEKPEGSATSKRAAVGRTAT